MSKTMLLGSSTDYLEANLQEEKDGGKSMMSYLYDIQRFARDMKTVASYGFKAVDLTFWCRYLNPAEINLTAHVSEGKGMRRGIMPITMRMSPGKTDTAYGFRRYSCVSDLVNKGETL